MAANVPLRILLVEDSHLTAGHVCELIQKHHPDGACITVESESEAMAEVERSVPDVIVLDLRLREGSGFNVLRKVSSRNPKPFTVVLTNYALPQYREFALLSGADYFLDKSTSLEALPTLLASFLERRRESSMEN